MVWSEATVFEPADGLSFGVLNLGEPPGGCSPAMRHRMQPLADPATASARLYELLHGFDDLGLDFILIITPPDDEPGWLAVLDRVRRATVPWPG